MSARPGLVAVDWGSSRFRAYLLDENGNLLDRAENNQGIFCHNQGGYEETLYNTCSQWLQQEPRIPILMAGMIGSRDGWVETEYLPCPVSIRSLGDNIMQVTDIHSHPVYIVPGISVFSSSTLPEVIRGEETQIFGILNQSADKNLLACVPGTHSKWIRVENNQIIRFSTFMTGEVFATVRHCGSISSLLDECDFDKNSFLEGICVSQSDGGLLHHLFSIRARSLSRQNGLKLNTSYLSGLLIGAEIKSALELYPEVTDIVVIGTDTLIHDYGLAFSAFDIAANSSTSEKAVVNGLWKLASTSEKVMAKMETLCSVIE